MKYEKTLVLDSSFMAKSIISTNRAFTIFYKGNAEVIDNHDEEFKLCNPDLKIKKPSVIRVFKYIKHYNNVALNRQNIFKRDNNTCVYCGSKHQLTIDHVIPQSKGGKDSWDNLVTACRPCNAEKADLTLEEYGKDITLPYRPHYLMLMKQMDHIPEEWKKYLFL